MGNIICLNGMPYSLINTSSSHLLFENIRRSLSFLLFCNLFDIDNSYTSTIGQVG
jgi:hypothetical protein